MPPTARVAKPWPSASWVVSARMKARTPRAISVRVLSRGFACICAVYGNFLSQFYSSGNLCIVVLQACEPCFVNGFPSVGQPLGEIAFGCEGQVGKQLRQVDLRIDVMPPAGRGDPGEDGCRTAATRVVYEEAESFVSQDALLY